MSASWGGKLEQRLSALGESASKESIQALAKWIGFNRKYASVITSVLSTALQNKSNSTARQWLYWQVVHEVLVLDLGTGSKWDRLLDLRSMLGETGVIPAIEVLGRNDQLVKPLDKLEGLVKQWDDHNVFGGPTLVSQIRRLVTSETSRATKTQSTATVTAITTEPSKASSSPQKIDPSAATTTAGATIPSPVKAPLTDASENQEADVKPADGGTIQPEAALFGDETTKTDERKPVAKRSSLSHVEQDVSYNFEDKVGRRIVERGNWTNR
jgi:hypothetical protein